MRWTWRFLVTGFTVTALASAAHATVIHVPMEYPTIQAGIDAAVNGDTVLVAEGLYTGDGNRDLDFWGKAIVVASENGPEVTIIECGGSYSNPHRGFVFHSGEGPGSVVYGFTIRNGYASNVHQENCGGGIVCIASSSPTIAGNVLRQNRAYWGGGLYCTNSSPTVVDNRIVENRANSGGGIYCRWYSTPVIASNEISFNIGDGGGGGISCLGSSPIITDNEITRNDGSWYGGGIELWYDCSPEIKNNTITWNTAGWGGGIFCNHDCSPIIDGNFIKRNNGGGIKCRDNSSPTIIKNTIIENSGVNGGGIECSSNSSPYIAHNRIIDNLGIGYIGGGGIYCSQASATIYSNMILGNESHHYGGGIFCASQPSPMILDNIISGNWAVDEGGGIFCRNASSPFIGGNTIRGNTAPQGGGIASQSSLPIISSTTITENVADEGGGIACLDTSSVMVLNCILWDDSASTNPEILVDGPSVIDVTYSDVDGGWVGEGNIDADPVFVLADKQDYRLLWESPCIDSGHPDSLDPDGTRSDIGAHFFDQDDFLTLYLTPDSPRVNLGGELGVTYTAINRWPQPRPFWAVTGVITPERDTLLILGPSTYTLPPDTTMRQYVTHDAPRVAPLGEYEYGALIGMPPSELYDEDRFVLTVGSTKTWRVPQDCPTIQAGIDSASNGDTVLVSDGTYTGPGNRDIDLWGKAIVVMSENGPESTIIDVQADSLDRHRGFYIQRGEGRNTVIKGFTITTGWAPPDTVLLVHGVGGAIWCRSTSPTITENHIFLNVAYQGGGIFCHGGTALIIDNEITDNMALWDGGGVGCGNHSTATLKDNFIAGNSAHEDGGGIWCWDYSSAIIIGNTVNGNTALLDGGGIMCGYQCAPTIEGNSITDNTAGRGGGIICLSFAPDIIGNMIAGNTAEEGGGIYTYSSPSIESNTITGNAAANHGGGIYCYWNSYPVVINSIFWGDSASTGSEIFLEYFAYIDVTYSDVQGGWPGEGNIDADPMFVTGPHGDYYLSQIEAGQPEQSPCVDAGNPESPVPDGTTRTDEVQDEWPVDMGYHYPLPGGSDWLKQGQEREAPPSDRR